MLYGALDWGRDVATRGRSFLGPTEETLRERCLTLALRPISRWTSGRAVKSELGARAYADEGKEGESSDDRSARCTRPSQRKSSRGRKQSTDTAHCRKGGKHVQVIRAVHLYTQRRERGRGTGVTKKRRERGFTKGEERQDSEGGASIPLHMGTSERCNEVTDRSQKD